MGRQLPLAPRTASLPFRAAIADPARPSAPSKLARNSLVTIAGVY